MLLDKDASSKVSPITALKPPIIFSFTSIEIFTDLPEIVSNMFLISVSCLVSKDVAVVTKPSVYLYLNQQCFRYLTLFHLPSL